MIAFGAILVNDGEILEVAENTADYEKGTFGHAEFNLVHKCANKYSDRILESSTLYTSCAPCTRCLMAINECKSKTTRSSIEKKE